MKKTFLCVFFVLLLCGCKSNQLKQPSLQGMIYNDSNEPVSDVRIYLKDSQIAISDIYGHFSLSTLDYGNSYELVFKKENYESITMSFSYLNPTQVIYVKIYSAKELLATAEKYVNQKKYDEALDILDRATVAEGPFLSINYLKSVIFYLKKDYESALKIANKILDSGYKDFYVYLLIADIYEYGLDNLQKSKEYLKEALSISYSPEVQERILKDD